MVGKGRHHGRQGPGPSELTGPLLRAEISAACPSWGPQGI